MAKICKYIFPTIREISKAYCKKVLKTITHYKHFTVCKGKLGNKFQTEFQKQGCIYILASNWYFLGPEIHKASRAEENLGRRVGVPNIAIYAWCIENKYLTNK